MGGYNGSTSLHFVEYNVNSDVYTNILCKSYMSFYQTGYILMQDNARPRVSTKTLDFLKENILIVIQLKILMVRRLNPGSKVYRSLDELIAEINIIWDSLEVDEIRRMVQSFPSRLTEVVENKGGNLRNY
ncbi:hypothetical protein A3Q56_00467 [Intoshia linei]|uniref:Tc1-like transposase DDE domain-containing protein n=1 Tax=Intoshia linei TaxID=1819745 RepID=A0A177BC34_9BILA|nr:hypothetical protein A3Q56_00467 [Intoshia linei]